MYANRQNFRVLMEIWVEEHDGEVRFYIESGNMAVLRMCNERFICNITLIYGRTAEMFTS